MNKVIGFLKEPLYFPILVLGVMYIIWPLIAPLDFATYFSGILILGIYISISVAAKIASANWKFTLIFIIFAFYFIYLLMLYAAWYLWESYYFGEYLPIAIFVVEVLLATIYPTVALVSSPTRTNRNTSLALFIALLPFLCSSLIYPIHFYPRVQEEEKLGDYKYYIVSSVDWDNHGFQSFYKCRFWRLVCKDLYSSYSGINRIVVDETNNEVNLLGYFGLAYTDGEYPRSYSQPAATFGDHIYQFSDTCNNFNNKEGYYRCESYTYTLYECNLDYKSCNRLPVQYTTEDDDLLLVIDGDNTKKEFNVYDDDPEYGGILILTYGEHPRCYVEGCEILGETK